MELHHISQQADGGTDDADSCIPVCFDCHAEIGHYNSQHPKGRKYTANELKAHRDKWFHKVASSEGQRSSADEKLRQVDQALFAELRSVLPYEGSIRFLRHHDFGGGFWHSSIEEVYQFIDWAADPGREFFDVDIEASKASLYGVAVEFRKLITNNTWVDRLNEHSAVEGDYWQSVPHEWIEHQPERFDKTEREINDAADVVCKSYESLVRIGWRRLAVI